MSRDKTFQAKMLDDGIVLDLIVMLQRRLGECEAEHIVEMYPRIPRKVTLRKLASMHRRGLIWCVPDRPIAILDPPAVPS